MEDIKDQENSDTFTIMFIYIRLLGCNLQSCQGVLLPLIRLHDLSSEGSLSNLVALLRCNKLNLQAIYLGC